MLALTNVHYTGTALRDRYQKSRQIPPRARVVSDDCLDKLHSLRVSLLLGIRPQH